MNPSFSKNTLVLLLSILFFVSAKAQIRNIPGPTGSGKFGTTVTLLLNGNYVVTDPGFDDGAKSDVGAVYLYDGLKHTVISMLKGSSPGDRVGSGGIAELAFGNFVVVSPYWKNATFDSAGAVTWCRGDIGFSNTVSASNSIVGGMPGVKTGSGGVTVLNNTTVYVICTPAWYEDSSKLELGAATWCDGRSLTSETISRSNSLTGSTAYDRVSSGGVRRLSNHYMILSPEWHNSAAAEAGAATFGFENASLSVTVSAANSLVGGSAGDRVGDSVIEIGSRYLVYIPNWTNDTTGAQAGAITWGYLGQPTGRVTGSNSLIGNGGDRLGIGGITILSYPSSGYVVNSYLHANGRGAVTWASEYSGISGYVSYSNSLVGTSINDQVGLGGVTALQGGNYVVCSPNWDNGSVDKAGAVTLCKGSTGTAGVVGTSNSLVGTVANAAIGSGGAVALSNGNFVVISPNWTMANFHPGAGAVTWGNGLFFPLTGVITPSNSLVGNFPNVFIGSGGVTALNNGNYVVSSPYWSDATRSFAGAVTWCDGLNPIADSVRASNSLIGTLNDYVGIGGVTALKNANYVVKSPYFSNGKITGAGAVTVCSGTYPTVKTVSPANSLVGTAVDDQIGLNHLHNSVTELANGNFVLGSPAWDNGSIRNAGALTFVSGSSGISGSISAANSLIGVSTDDSVGNGPVRALPSGHYIAFNGTWDNSSVIDAGAITLGNGSSGVRGEINSCNSVVGYTSIPLSLAGSIYKNDSDLLIVGKPGENILTHYSPSAYNLVTSNSSASVYLSGINSTQFVNDSCEVIAGIRAAYTNPVSGNITAKVYLDTSARQFFGKYLVRRHFDISPEPSQSLTGARITLYFTQADFDDYNRKSSPFVLPQFPNDVAYGLRVAQFHGNSASGEPGSYSGWTGGGPAIVTIDPADKDIVWNSAESRWEVSFDVNGFSGFFLFSGQELSAPEISRMDDIRIVPIPSKDYISILNLKEETEAAICDIQGKELKSMVLRSSIQVGIHELPAGMYLLKLRSGKVLRFIKQ